MSSVHAMGPCTLFCSALGHYPALATWLGPPATRPRASSSGTPRWLGDATRRCCSKLHHVVACCPDPLRRNHLFQLSVRCRLQTASQTPTWFRAEQQRAASSDFHVEAPSKLASCLLGHGNVGTGDAALAVAQAQINGRRSPSGRADIQGKAHPAPSGTAPDIWLGQARAAHSDCWCSIHCRQLDWR